MFSLHVKVAYVQSWSHINEAPNGLRYWRWAGWENVWEQEKPEARKILENAAESPASSARFVGWLERRTRWLKKTPHNLSDDTILCNFKSVNF